MLTTRRTVIRALPVAAVLAACATSATTLQMAQTYGDDLIDAMLGAAQVYIASPTTSASDAALVKVIVNDLTIAEGALNSVTNTPIVGGNATTVIQEIITDVQTLLPYATPFLGAAAPYVPLAIAVLQAFLDALPPPSNAPATPPAALHSAAEQYRAAVRAKALQLRSGAGSSH